MTQLEATYTVEELAERFHITIDSVRRWIRTGKLPALKIGRRYFVTESELVRFMSSKPAEGNSKS